MHILSTVTLQWQKITKPRLPILLCNAIVSDERGRRKIDVPSKGQRIKNKIKKSNQICVAQRTYTLHFTPFYRKCIIRNKLPFSLIRSLIACHFMSYGMLLMKTRLRLTAFFSPLPAFFSFA